MVKKTRNEHVAEKLSTKQKSLLTYIILAFVIFFVLFIRLRLLGIPLERDEGEYAYMGQLLLQGILPYTEAYNMKFPGIYLIYTLILMIFGQTHTGIHLALVFVNVGTSILLFLLSRCLFKNNVVSIVSASCFLIMMLSPTVQGFWANSEHFVIFLAISGILLMVKSLERHSIKGQFLSGLLLGTLFLIKQHGILFTLFGFICFCLMYLKKRPLFTKEVFINLGLFSFAVTIPFALTCITFLVFDSFDKFWFWTFEYASKYASSIPISQGPANLKRTFMPILKSNFPIMIVALFGLISIFWSKTKKSKWVFIFGFFIASFLSTCPGFYFRPHYYILLMPAIALLTGIGVYSTVEKIPRFRIQVIVASCIVLFSLAYPIVNQRVFLFNLSPDEACRATYGLNPFPESIEIARFINKNTDEDDRIVVLGSEPQIYFYSKRKAATGYIYTYALMESHDFALKMQKEMISEIESNDPKYIVFTNIPTSWLMRHDSEKLLLNWANQYVSQRYELSGIVDLVSNDSIIYKWDDEVKGYSPRSELNIYVFKKL